MSKVLCIMVADYIGHNVSYEMALLIDTTRVRDVSIVRCAGRIAEGPESRSLQLLIEQDLSREAKVVVDLSRVEAVDSTGLGLLVRWLSRTQTLGGSLKLCAVPGRIRDVLRVTRLAAVFEVFDSEGDAVAVFQQPIAPAAMAGIGTDVLCVDQSPNILAFLREALRQDGYRVATTASVGEAVMLLQSAPPKVVVVSAALRAARDTRVAKTFNELLDGRPLIELSPTFSSDNPATAEAAVFDRVRALIAAHSAAKQ